MLKAAEFYVCELRFNELTFKNHNFLLKFSYYFPTILFNDLAIQNNVTFYQLNREKNPCIVEVESLINSLSPRASNTEEFRHSGYRIQ